MLHNLFMLWAEGKILFGVGGGGIVRSLRAACMYSKKDHCSQVMPPPALHQQLRTTPPSLIVIYESNVELWAAEKGYAGLRVLPRMPILSIVKSIIKATNCL